MDTLLDAHDWAESEFGQAAIPDARNVARLVQMAQRVAERPLPKVSAVFTAPAELEAAFDFLENARIDPEALVASSQRATARRARGLTRVLVAVDEVLLTLPDPFATRGMGSVGSRSRGARGLVVMDAVALTEQGVPLGLAGLVSWARPLRRNPRPHHRRPPGDKETRYWLVARQSIREALRREAPATQIVLLHDSAADAWPVLLGVTARDRHAGEFTVLRAARDRRASAGSASPSHLRALLRRAPDRWRVRQWIPAKHGQRARRAKVEIRFRAVTLDLELTPSSVHVPVTLWAVQVHEVGRLGRGVERLDWVLLTDCPLGTRAEALEAVRWYTLRWRVEDHHKRWKRSGSDIEATQLRSRGAIERWMALHAAVSARALALVHRARDPLTGGAPATQAYSASELIALRALRRECGMDTPLDLSVSQATRLVAIMGGFRPISDRRYGPMTLGRGLERLVVGAAVIKGLQEETGPPEKPRRNRRK
jgi:hypothetical protein